MKLFTQIGMIIALLLVATLSSAQVAVDLRPTWTQGQTSRYRLVQTEVQTAELVGIGEAQQSTTKITVELTWKVVEAGESGGTAELTVDAMQFELTDPRGESHTVTATEGPQQLEAMQTYIGAIVGSPVMITVEPDGTISEASGFDKIKSAAGPAGESIDADFFIELVRDLAVLNAGPAAAEPGATWSFTTETDHAIGSITGNTTDQFLGTEQIAGVNVAMIAQTTEMDVTPELPDVPAGGPTVEVDVTEASYAGQIMFDLSRHEVVGAQGKQVIAAEVTISAQGRTITRTSREETDILIIRIAED